jgi:hypothetical protein
VVWIDVPGGRCDLVARCTHQHPDDADKADGIRIGRAVADAVLALRSDDGSDGQPIPYVFGTAPGNYQSPPPNFPSQPQFTHWSRVTPFTLKHADPFRPGCSITQVCAEFCKAHSSATISIDWHRPQ